MYASGRLCIISASVRPAPPRGGAAVIRDGHVVADGPTSEVLEGIVFDVDFEKKFDCELSFRESAPQRLKALDTEGARTGRNPSMYSDMSQRYNSDIRNEEDTRMSSLIDQQ